VGAGDSFTGTQGNSLAVPLPGLLANDTDVDGDPLTLSVLRRPTNGQLAIAADGTFTYTPRLDFVGTDTFSYTAYDGDLCSAPVTVTLAIRPAVRGTAGSGDEDGSGGDGWAGSGSGHSGGGTDSGNVADGGSGGETTSPGGAPGAGQRGGGTAGDTAAHKAHRTAVTAKPSVVAAAGPVSAESAGHSAARAEEMVWAQTPRRKAAPRHGLQAHTDGQAAETTESQPDAAATGLDLTTLCHQFDTLSQELREHRSLQTGVVAGVALGTLTLSTLYVMWTLKGGCFLAALLASTPAWRYIDVLPILDFHEAEQKERSKGRAPRRITELDWVRD
jgi:hypothetical protein